ncbi:type I 3-dehydroquinate dehydratase [Novosphingobium sp. BL-52-GroH]|uniref:type I 3-dehydroquinate dehydratase n=1 Tax=Novosphingobium sp. BL-52-GroH TaxID=3349877 RepID=UPI00384C08A7
MPTFDRRQGLSLAALAAAMPSLVAGAVSAGAREAVTPTPRTIDIRGVEIGGGRTKTIVSLIQPTLDAVLAQARVLGGMSEVDVVEYRLDYLEAAPDPKAVAATIRPVAAAIAGKPLVVTFRTSAEGGRKAISPADYAALYQAVLASGAVDVLDIEAALLPTPPVAAVQVRAKALGVRVILSHHDFHHTPSVETMIDLLRQQQAAGADICKIAVMPQDPGDLLRLLDATWTMRRDHADRPMITMAMGGVGAVSRLAGEIFGSAMSFGAVGEVSAPGQIEVGKLRGIIDTLHEALSV